MVHPTCPETHQSHEIEVDTQLSLLEAVSLHSPARIAGLYIWVPPGYIKKLMKGITFTPFHPCFVLLSYPGQSWEDPQVVWSGQQLQLRQKVIPPTELRAASSMVMSLRLCFPSATSSPSKQALGCVRSAWIFLPEMVEDEAAAQQLPTGCCIDNRWSWTFHCIIYHLVWNIHKWTSIQPYHKNQYPTSQWPNAQGSQMLQLLSTIQLPKQCWRLTDPSSGPNGSTSVHSRHRRPHFLALKTLKLPRKHRTNGIDQYTAED